MNDGSHTRVIKTNGKIETKKRTMLRRGSVAEKNNKFDGFKGNGIRERPVVILGGNRDDHRQYKREDALPVCECVVRALLRAAST